MHTALRFGWALALSALLAGCTASLPAAYAPQPALRPANLEPAPPAAATPSAINALVTKYAALYSVPESLIHRVIVRESGYNPNARNGPYWGLMQIRYDTAMSMGYHGPASGLLDAETNLKFGVKYLSGAYKVGDGNPDRAVHNFASGYYYAAKKKGLLEEVGLR